MEETRVWIKVLFVGKQQVGPRVIRLLRGHKHLLVWVATITSLNARRVCKAGKCFGKHSSFSLGEELLTADLSTDEFIYV